MTFLFVFLVILICMTAILGVRNAYVYRARMKMLRQVSAAAKRDIQEGSAFRWRYHHLDTVDYNHMVLVFWRPAMKFYTDHSFLDPNVRWGTPIDDLPGSDSEREGPC